MFSITKMGKKSDHVSEQLANQRKVVVAVREFTKASKTFVEHSFRRLFFVFRSAGGGLIFGGDKRTTLRAGRQQKKFKKDFQEIMDDEIEDEEEDQVFECIFTQDVACGILPLFCQEGDKARGWNSDNVKLFTTLLLNILGAGQGGTVTVGKKGKSEKPAWFRGSWATYYSPSYASQEENVEVIRGIFEFHGLDMKTHCLFPLEGTTKTTTTTPTTTTSTRAASSTTSSSTTTTTSSPSSSQPSTSKPIKSQPSPSHPSSATHDSDGQDTWGIQPGQEFAAGSEEEEKKEDEKEEEEEEEEEEEVDKSNKKEEKENKKGTSVEKEEEELSEYEKIRVNNIQERENLLKNSGVLAEIGALKETEMSKTVTFNLLKKPAPAKKRKRKTFEEENKEMEERRTSNRNKKKSLKQKEAEEAQSWSGE